MSDPDVKLIKPGEYPVLSEERGKSLRQALRSSATVKAAGAVLEKASTILQDGVIAALGRLEQSGTDTAKVYEAAHDIRGLAGNAKLPAAGRISGLLCRYLDAVKDAGRAPDPAIVRLHVVSIAHAVRATDPTGILGEQVTRELTALLNRKLVELKPP